MQETQLLHSMPFKKYRSEIYMKEKFLMLHSTLLKFLAIIDELACI